jgi:pyruvate dehydrogenase E1 component
MYRFAGYGNGEPAIRLLGSGAILPEVIAAAKLLAEEWGIATEVHSVTSFSELAREAREVERANRLNPGLPQKRSLVEESLSGSAPVVAATDYVRAYPQLIATAIQARYVTLGTDGFGRSDTRSALRAFFEVDRHHVAVAALAALADEGTLDRAKVAEAVARYGLSPNRPAPWTV